MRWAQVFESEIRRSGIEGPRGEMLAFPPYWGSRGSCTHYCASHDHYWACGASSVRPLLAADPRGDTAGLLPRRGRIFSCVRHNATPCRDGGQPSP